MRVADVDKNTLVVVLTIFFGLGTGVVVLEIEDVVRGTVVVVVVVEIEDFVCGTVVGVEVGSGTMIVTIW